MSCIEREIGDSSNFQSRDFTLMIMPRPFRENHLLFSAGQDKDMSSEHLQEIKENLLFRSLLNLWKYFKTNIYLRNHSGFGDKTRRSNTCLIQFDPRKLLCPYVPFSDWYFLSKLAKIGRCSIRFSCQDTHCIHCTMVFNSPFTLVNDAWCRSAAAYPNDDVLLAKNMNTRVRSEFHHWSSLIGDRR